MYLMNFVFLKFNSISIFCGLKLEAAIGCFSSDIKYDFLWAQIHIYFYAYQVVVSWGLSCTLYGTVVPCTIFMTGRGEIIKNVDFSVALKNLLRLKEQNLLLWC